MVLATHFLGFPQVRRATVSLREHRWTPIAGARGPARDAFRRAGDATRTASVAATPGSTVVESGLEDLVVMKTAKSAFAGFPRDRYTTLGDARDRIMATRLTAMWRHAVAPPDWDASHEAIYVTKSHSRPSVSNDNPYSESQLKTMKYRPQFPDRFGSIEDARSFCHLSW